VGKITSVAKVEGKHSENPNGTGSLNSDSCNNSSTFVKTPEGCLGILSAYQLAISKFSPNVGNFKPPPPPPPKKKLCEKGNKQMKQTCLDSHGLMSIGR